MARNGANSISDTQSFSSEKEPVVNIETRVNLGEAARVKGHPQKIVHRLAENWYMLGQISKKGR